MKRYRVLKISTDFIGINIKNKSNNIVSDYFHNGSEINILFPFSPQISGGKKKHMCIHFKKKMYVHTILPLWMFLKIRIQYF